jgi:beta-aspartyl-peptidase (threonine type)
MKRTIFSMIFCLGFIFPLCGQDKGKTAPFGIVIHGGAGIILKKDMIPEMEKKYREKLEEALAAGYKVLENNGSSLDAVAAAIRVMEDSRIFNAGAGSVLTSEGKNEMDASIMDGRTLKAGAVAGLRRIKNPVIAARCVMDKSPHVFMAGQGAENFAFSCGCATADSAYFISEKRLLQLKKAKEEERNIPLKRDTLGFFMPDSNRYNDFKFGTVGAVALDKNGNLAAATSTGGMTNKKEGRIGDSPIIGAGTYANNRTCAVSCTGHGEFFIRHVVAYDISALMEYKEMNLKEATEKVILDKLVKVNGEGGVIAIDAKGNIAMTFNTPGMYRAFKKSDGKTAILIYKTE